MPMKSYLEFAETQTQFTNVEIKLQYTSIRKYYNIRTWGVFI
jgi:hypothetical protein